jgi:glucose dehydrogenase
MKLYALRVTGMKLYALRFTGMKLYALRVTGMKLYALRVTGMRVYALRVTGMKLYPLVVRGVTILRTLWTLEVSLKLKYLTEFEAIFTTAFGYVSGPGEVDPRISPD